MSESLAKRSRLPSYCWKFFWKLRYKLLLFFFVSSMAFFFFFFFFFFVYSHRQDFEEQARQWRRRKVRTRPCVKPSTSAALCRVLPAFLPPKFFWSSRFSFRTLPLREYLWKTDQNRVLKFFVVIVTTNIYVDIFIAWH